MAIVTMKRLTLLAMPADKEAIFDALIKSGVVHLRSSEVSSENRAEVSATVEELWQKSRRIEEAIRYLTEQTAFYNAENKRDKSVPKAEVPKNSFARPKTEVDYDCFLSFGKNAAAIEESVDAVFALKNRIAELNIALQENAAERAKVALYEELPHPTDWYKDTASSTVQLCLLPSNQWEPLKALAGNYETVSLEKLCGDNNSTVVVAVAHKSQSDFFEQAVALGLAKSTFKCDVLPKLLLKDFDDAREKLLSEMKEVKAKIVAFDTDVPQWKIYVDYLGLCAKKAAVYGYMPKTTSTFVLEGFYPAEEETKVTDALGALTDNMVVYFDDVGKDEFAPTLTKNNALVSPFEAVTNTYTPPDYHEVDPNPVMSVFYFIIFGFMVADIGYGLLLVILGLAATFLIKQRSGLKNMIQMFGICGVAAIAVGALFGSFFAYSLYPGVIPDPAQHPMVMMILSLMVGITHIMAGVGCKMAVKIKHGEKLSAWLADFPWLFVFLGLIVAIWNAALDMASYEPYNVLRLPEVVTNIGLYVCLAALAVGLICAGIGTKGFMGKVVKSFGSAYGIISYFSDVMSYIRVFGLMLSSALIGSVVNQLGQMVLGNGGIGYIFAALVLVVAHLFNLAMGVLSVYIHNGRLAYVEFFNKFYTGEGTLFVPFGSDTKYTLLTSAAAENK